jgi:HK97 family phage prohead protease
MEKVFNLTSTFKSQMEDDGSIMIRGMASTVDFDRAGDSIASEAWQKGGMSNFEKNPIILFNHNYDKPIGRATGLKAGPNGLEMEAKISKHADCANLIKDGVLGAFSVGFRVKDADYLEETDGLRIKDAELFEVSVVSVPCNQSATFSLAKSFDSMSEYEDFKKTFTNSDGTKVQKEIQMSEQAQQPVDLEAFAKKVAEETAAKIAMKQAEVKAADEAVQKAADEKAAAEAVAKTQQETEVKTAIAKGVETGAELLLNDIRKEFESEKANTAEIIEKYKKDLEEKAAEIEAMQNSKRDFSGRSGQKQLTAFGQEFLQAKVLGAITGKGYETQFSKELLEKAGVDYTSTTAAGIDVIVSQQFEEEVRQAQKVAPAFREIAVSSGATVLPLAPDAGAATFSAAGITASANQLSDAGDNNYTVSQVILQAHRLIAGTFISNDTDEQTVVTLLPIVTSALARAHAVAIDKAILVGAGAANISVGLTGNNGTDNTSGFATVSGQTALDASGAGEVTPANLLAMRKEMGKYGLDPSRVAFVVPTDVYYELIDASGFTDVTEVGNDLATKRIGVVGSVFGSPVIATDQLAQNLGAGGAVTTTAALAINVDNYVIPRLKGVNIETEYSVKDQQNVIVASQSLGFNELFANAGTNKPSIFWPYQ